MGAQTRRVTGFRPMRCSSVAKTSIGFPGCFAASSITASVAFFECSGLCRRSRFRVFWTWLLDRPADRLQSLPSTLCRDRCEAEFVCHPRRHLAARPQSALGGGLAKTAAPVRHKGGAQGCCRCTVAAAQIAERLSSLRVVTGKQLFDPSLAKCCRCRNLRNGVAARQKPDHLEMPRCGRILTSHVALLQLFHA